MEPNLEPSEIVDFYKGSTIFLTGGTGYLGKLFLEKLLRACYDLNRVYVLVRPKKGVDVKTRFQEIFSTPNFDPLYRLYPNFISKVHLIPGDCVLPDLGLSEEDKQKLISEVDIVIHCAATVRFDQTLKTAAYINVRSVQDIITMSKKMKKLKGALYISTAFSNCIRKDIDETFYEPPLSPKKLFSLLDSLEDDQLVKITPLILQDYPNTYAFTKAIAEDLIKSEAKSLPIAVYRPSIVVGTVKEPVAGWIDNMYGLTGVILAGTLGLLHSLQSKPEHVAEIIPADYVINGGLATLWEIGTTTKPEPTSEVPVYNCVSSPESPLTWGRAKDLLYKHADAIPSPLQVWYPFVALRPNRLHHLTSIFFYHTVPSYVVDFLCRCIGKKPMLVEGYKKINKFLDVIGYFTINEWEFSNNNTQKLWKRMSKRDQEIFEFSMASFDWDDFFGTYLKGGRVYLLKDPMDTIPAGRIKYMKLTVAHYSVLAFLALIAFGILMLLLKFFTA